VRLSDVYTKDERVKLCEVRHHESDAEQLDAEVEAGWSELGQELPPLPEKPEVLGQCLKRYFACIRDSEPHTCPFVTCKYHLYLDINFNGTIRVNFPDVEPEDLTPCCAIISAMDAGKEGMTLSEIGRAMNLTRERVRQILDDIIAQVGDEFSKSLPDCDEKHLRDLEDRCLRHPTRRLERVWVSVARKRLIRARLSVDYSVCCTVRK
jgi:hypothetical protein